MKNKNTLLLTTMLSLIVSLSSTTSFAAQANTNTAETPRASKKVPAMRNRVYAQLARAQQTADAGDKVEGLEILDAVKDRLDDLNSYERAMLFNFYGFMYYGDDQVAEAIDSFNKVVAETEIPDSLILSTYYSLAQLSMQQQDFKAALSHLNKWKTLNGKALTSNQEMLFAQVYYQDKDFVNSLKHTEKAIELVEAEGKLPKENWLTLQRATYYELKQPEQVTKVMEKLVRLYDKPQYWLQLSSMYGEIGQEAKQMAVMEAAYQAGYVVEESDISTLSQLYLFHGAPYKSASVLEMAIAEGSIVADEDNLNRLARAYLTAKEDDKAIKVLQQVSNIAQTGEYDALLAQTYLNSEQWQAAITSSNLALARFAKQAEQGLAKAKDNEKDTANMYLILGMANFNLKEFDSSLNAFNKATQFASTQKAAEQWEKYVAREEEQYQIQLAMLN
ncbi:hypothetical protein [Colwellia sp. E2M01]|uniref:tetratricopeptide repeat protein n=1 Tax=Colwellia sp. E2M01 TaxID=2841561 RepID=UPI001C090C06|nr:hypothetical protein [Colwellia sp. E2M01]MBU2870070.1 hypothetical protein [Colwellia sp. E2M01]